MKEVLQIVNRHSRQTISLPYLRKKIRQIFSCLGLKGSTLELTLVDDVSMKRQNRRHRGKNRTTDVLSFPQITPKKNIRNFKQYEHQFLGDILISLDQARKQANEQNIALQREVVFLTIHSVLHLLGFDHETEKQRIQMQSLESKIWLRVMGRGRGQT